MYHHSYLTTPVLFLYPWLQNSSVKDTSGFHVQNPKNTSETSSPSHWPPVTTFHTINHASFCLSSPGFHTITNSSLCFFLSDHSWEGALPVTLLNITVLFSPCDLSLSDGPHPWLNVIQMVAFIIPDHSPMPLIAQAGLWSHCPLNSSTWMFLRKLSLKMSKILPLNSCLLTLSTPDIFLFLPCYI